MAGSFVSLARLVAAVKTDKELQQIMRLVDEGSGERTKWLEMSSCVQYRGCLVLYQQELLYKHRVAIPVSLRQEVLASLHGAHQGTTNMLARAMQSVWWPGLSKDLERVRRECPRCTLEAPRQLKNMQEPKRKQTTSSRWWWQTTVR